MKIVISSLESAYSLLREGLKREDGEDWKVREEPKIRGLRFDPIDLPLPFLHVCLAVHKIGECYSAVMPFYARGKNLFHYCDRQWIEKVKERGFEWEPTSECAGYMLSPDKIVQMTILSGASDEEAHIRVVSMGTHGAVLHRLEDEDKFVSEMKGLEGIANLFFNSCADSLIKEELMKRNPELVLHFSL